METTSAENGVNGTTGAYGGNETTGAYDGGEVRIPNKCNAIS